MARVYKRSCDNDQRRPAWYFSYVDEFGVRRQRKGFTDKAATEKLALKSEEEARMVREGLEESVPNEQQIKLSVQLDLYLKHLRQRDVSQTQIENVRLRIEKTVERCGFVTIVDIATQAVEDYLAKRRDGGMSKQTSNHYRQSIHQFCRWLHKRSFIKTNPIAEIPKLNVDTDRRHDRRALTVDEFQRLVAAAEVGKPVEAIDGIDRAMMYILSAWTGYRRGEISSLTLGSFELDADPPRVTVDASYSKRRQKEVQILHPDVAERVRNWLTVRTPKHQMYLFPLTKETCGSDRKTSKMMKLDLEVARETWIDEAPTAEEREKRVQSDYLRYENHSGLFADFHANRHTFITNLARAGVSPKVAQTLARHSDIRLTMNVYTHTDLAEKVDAVSRLPSLGEVASSQKPRVERRDGPNGAELDQRYSSTLEAVPDLTGQSVAIPAETQIHKSGMRARRKSISENDLSADDDECHEIAEVRPAGFEPATLGSEDSLDVSASTYLYNDLRKASPGAAAPQQHPRGISSHTMTVPDSANTSAPHSQHKSVCAVSAKLARIIQAWPSLPPHVQETILQLVDTLTQLPPNVTEPPPTPSIQLKCDREVTNG